MEIFAVYYGKRIISPLHHYREVDGEIGGNPATLVIAHIRRVLIVEKIYHRRI